MKSSFEQAGHMRYADLHIHSVFSDSTYTPQELVVESKKAGLSAIALVDHDTVDGIQLTKEIADRENLELVTGIEFTAEHDGQEIHILGYLIDHTSKSLTDTLEILKKNRVERVYKIVDKLKNIGVALEAKSVLDIAGEGTVGRLHVARAMVQEGFVNTVTEAFQKYIGDRSPAYVLGFKLTPLEAIGLIREAGGVSVLAHPYSLNHDDLIPVFVGYGLMGLEVYYPEHTQSRINFYLGLAKKYNLLVTGGSDCHGTAKPEVRIGSVKIPYELVENLKAAKAQIP